MNKDIIIIGGGPGGYVAAIRAAQLGAKVCIVEKDELGGTCLNRGCIPTKALYRNAEILNLLKDVNKYGICVDSYSIDVDKIQQRKQYIVEQLVGGISQLIKANNIELVKGKAVLKDKNTVAVSLDYGTIKEITASNIIIATGAKPTIPTILGNEIEGVFTSDTILDFKTIPKSLTIIGAGVIGLEFACIFNALATNTTVIEYMSDILPMVDSDITKRLVTSLKKKGIKISTSTQVKKIEKVEDEYIVYCKGKKGEIKINSEYVLLATGRTPIVEGLNLEGLNCYFDKTGIKVDKNYETNIKNIYAVGDVTGKVMLAHAASHQGIIAAEHIMGLDRVDKSEVVSNCIFTFPEIASVGITEEEAKQRGLSYKVSKFLFTANGKALTLGESEGMVKVISTVSKRPGEEMLLGAHIMGPHASDLIQEAVLAINNKLKVEDIIRTIHAHPTLSEAFSEAVMGIKGEGIHMVNIKK